MSNETFSITGAGQIRLSQNTESVCGMSAGFSFEYLSNYATCSHFGVLSIKEAKRLAEFILQKISEQPLSEDEIVSKAYQELER